MKKLAWLLIAALAIFVPGARGQVSVQVRDNSGGILGTFNSGTIILKCDTTMTCTVSGVTILMSPNGGSSPSGNILTFVGTAVTTNTINFSNTDPAPGTAGVNVLWQTNTGHTPNNVSAYVPPCLASGSTHAPGAVPDPGASAGTSHWLREDCSWQLLPTGFYQTIQAAGSSQTQRAKLNFLSPIIVADNSGNGSTDISIPATPVCANGGGHTAGLVPDPTSGGTSGSYLGADCAFHTLPSSGITLKTNGTNNGSQTILNLKAGSNITIADDGVGGITITSTGGGGGGTAFQSLQRQTTMIADGATTTLELLGDINSACTFTVGTVVAQVPTSANGAAVEYPPSGGPGQGLIHCGLNYVAGRNAKMNVKGYYTATGDNFGWLGLFSSFSNYLTGTRQSTPAASTGSNYEAFLIGNKQGTGGSPHWFACNGDGAADTCTDTGITQDTASHSWAIVEESGTDVLFYIDGALVATNTTHLPTSGSLMGFVESQWYTTTPYNFGLTQILIASDL